MERQALFGPCHFPAKELSNPGSAANPLRSVWCCQHFSLGDNPGLWQSGQVCKTVPPAPQRGAAGTAGKSRQLRHRSRGCAWSESCCARGDGKNAALIFPSCKLEPVWISGWFMGSLRCWAGVTGGDGGQGSVSSSSPLPDQGQVLDCKVREAKERLFPNSRGTQVHGTTPHPAVSTWARLSHQERGFRHTEIIQLFYF